MPHAQPIARMPFEPLSWEAMTNVPPILESFRLDQKIALVTGSSSGIGPRHRLWHSPRPEQP